MNYKMLISIFCFAYQYFNVDKKVWCRDECIYRRLKDAFTCYYKTPHVIGYNLYNISYPCIMNK